MTDDSRDVSEEKEYPHEPKRGKTHWVDCWKAKGHHNCAVARVRELEQERDALRELLEPFTHLDPDARDDALIYASGIRCGDGTWIDVEHIRKARSALDRDEGRGEERPTIGDLVDEFGPIIPNEYGIGENDE